MSETACPACGHKVKQYRNPFVGIVACTNDACYFRCNAGDFDRISAAMDYTKCQIDLHGDFGFPESHMQWLREEEKKAWERVKEVFAA